MEIPTLQWESFLSSFTVVRISMTYVHLSIRIVRQQEESNAACEKALGNLSGVKEVK